MGRQNVPNRGRSRLRERAVIALLQEPTLEKAAQATGVGLRTLQRWLNDANFQELYRKAKNDLLANATAQLRAASGRAVTVLDAIANNRRVNPAARVSAARCILELGLRAHEIEDLWTEIQILKKQGGRGDEDAI